MENILQQTAHFNSQRNDNDCPYPITMTTVNDNQI